MSLTKKSKINFLMCLIITGLTAFLLGVKLPFLETLEEKLYDYRFKFRGPIKPPETIAIAAIDEKSIERFGRWPWSRDKIVRLIKRLAEEGVEIIVFDIFFTEKEKHDRDLGNAIRGAGNVIAPIVFEFDRRSEEPNNQYLLNSAFKSIVHPKKFNQYSPIRTQRPLTPIAEVLREAMAFGHINMFPDSDGVLRWEAMVVEYNGYLFPSIDLQAAALYLGIPNERMILNATEGIQLGEKRYIPTDRHGRNLINYYGPTHTFKYLSIADILDGTIEPKSIQGKIVIIGPTAVGIYDLRVTPLSAAMPGVEKHATVISSVIENRFLRSASSFTNLIILLLSGIGLSLLVIWLRVVGVSLVTGLFLLMIFSSGYLLFAHQGIWINITYPSMNILLIFISIIAYNYAVEERHARQIKAMFSSYVTERIVNELIKNPGMAKLGGERKEMTVLFSDVRGFTTFAEKHPPEEVVATLNEYLGAMTEVIFRWEGTLDKFIGDAILAFWGAPIKQENHAELAVRCALNMADRLEALRQKWQSEGKPILDAGIGINTGEVLVGNIGAEGKKMDYTVIGDHVNLGSRVESLTRQFNAHILITEFTLNGIKELVHSGRISHVSIRTIDRVSIKGKENIVEIYEIQSLEHGMESKVLMRS